MDAGNLTKRYVRRLADIAEGGIMVMVKSGTPRSGRCRVKGRVHSPRSPTRVSGEAAMLRPSSTAAGP
jgi:delta-aminolevulinic acid dehydratase/porphobilinogen synthase